MMQVEKTGTWLDDIIRASRLINAYVDSEHRLTITVRIQCKKESTVVISSLTCLRRDGSNIFKLSYDGKDIKFEKGSIKDAEELIEKCKSIENDWKWCLVYCKPTNLRIVEIQDYVNVINDMILSGTLPTGCVAHYLIYNFDRDKIWPYKITCPNYTLEFTSGSNYVSGSFSLKDAKEKKYTFTNDPQYAFAQVPNSSYLQPVSCYITYPSEPRSITAPMTSEAKEYVLNLLKETFA